MVVVMVLACIMWYLFHASYISVWHLYSPLCFTYATHKGQMMNTLLDIFWGKGNMQAKSCRCITAITGKIEGSRWTMMTITSLLFVSQSVGHEHDDDDDHHTIPNLAIITIGHTPLASTLDQNLQKKIAWKKLRQQRNKLLLMQTQEKM